MLSKQRENNLSENIKAQGSAKNQFSIRLLAAFGQ